MLDSGSLLLLLLLLLWSPPLLLLAADEGEDQLVEGASEPAAEPAASEAWEQSVDSVHTERLTKLAFGSCSKQLQPQPLWTAIAAFEPQAWLWAGDAVYMEGGSGSAVEKLREAYATQLLQPGYATLLRRDVTVLGTWDDHDYGRNDAGRWLPFKQEAQDLFLDFIQQQQQRSPNAASELRRRQRQGVYSSHTFGLPPEQVKVILLDTRFSRDSHIIPSVGGVRIPLSPLMAAAVRGTCSHCSIGSDFEGDMLGDEQWAWLSAQLADSRAAVHIIVSSVQVQTSNPLVESWGHFPASRAKLLGLLAEHRPAGLLLVSGDVHFAEMSSNVKSQKQQLEHAEAEGGMEGEGVGGEAADADAAAAAPLLEVTSSGMTHTCTTASYGAICDPLIRHFSGHRTKPEAFFTGLNWGSVEIEWPTQHGQGQEVQSDDAEAEWPRVVVSIRDAEGQVQLQELVPPGRAPPHLPEQAGSSLYELPPLVPTPTLSIVAWCGVWMWLSFIGILGAIVQCYSILRPTKYRGDASSPAANRPRSLTADGVALPVFITAASTKISEEAAIMARVASQGNLRGLARHVRARSFGDPAEAEK
jgi:alkaline phosphatase D